MNQNRGSPPTFNSLLQHHKVSEPNQQGFPHMFQSVSQRNSPPPKNLQMIKEDMDVTDSVAMVTDEGEEDESATQQQRQRSFVQNPQISITDTQGHVTEVPENVSENVPEEVQFIDTSQQISTAVPLTQRYPLFSNYPAFNASLYQSLESNDSSAPSTTLNASLPMYGLFHTGLNQTFEGGTNLSQRQNTNSGRHHRRFHTVQTTRDALLQTQRLQHIPHTEQLNFGAYFSPSNSTSQINDLNKTELSLSQSLLKLKSPGDIVTPSSVEGMNLRNSLGDMSQEYKFAVSVNLTSRKELQEILAEIKRTLDNKAPELAYQYSDNLFRLRNCDVSMEMEICRSGSMNGLRFRKVAGDQWQYKRLCNELMTCMDL